MDKKNAKNLILLFVLTLLTKGLGFLKTSITAASFGMSIETDIYNLADGVMNQVFYAFTISIALIIVPLYLEKVAESPLAGKRFAKSAYYSIWGFGGALFALVAVLAPLLARLMGREYAQEHIQLLTKYMWILSVGMVLSLVANALQSILNAASIYGYPSICAMINSAVIIGFILLFADTLGIWAMVFAVPVAFLIQTVILNVRAAPLMKVSLRKEKFDPSVKKLYTQMVPVFMSNASMELNGFVDKYILAGLNAGAVTAISYANVLLVFATNIITIPVTTILFTDVSTLCAQKKYDQVRTVTETTIVKILMLCLPVVGITVLCSRDIVNSVFGYGLFGAEAVSMTAKALMVYGLSIVFYVLKDVINRVCYALQETKIPMVASIVGAVVHIAVALLLVKAFDMVAVAVGTVIGVAFMAVYTYLRLSKKYLRTSLKPYAGSFGKIAIALMAMLAVVLLLANVPLHFAVASQILSIGRFVGCTAVGFIVYFGLLLAMKETYITEIIGSFLKRK